MTGKKPVSTIGDGLSLYTLYNYFVPKMRSPASPRPGTM